MSPFREKLFYLLLWRAILVSLFALVLSVTRCLDLRGALLTSANVALLFAIGLILWSDWMGADRIGWTKAWRTLRPDERPAGVVGRTVAYHYLCGLALRFAKGSSAVAVAMSALALLLVGE